MFDVDGRIKLVRKTVTPAKVGVIGLGYVGLTTSLALLEAGVNVVGCDRSEDRLSAIEGLSDGLSADEKRRLDPFLGLRFTLTSCIKEACQADAVIICVPTPVDQYLIPDLEPLQSACTEVVDHAVPLQLIVLASTTYVGSTRDMLAAPLEAAGFHIGDDIFVAFSPERVDPGNQEYTQDNVPRVLGGITSECAGRAAMLLSLISSQVHVVPSAETAELTKLYENTFRAVNIAFVNELADVAEKLGVDPLDVINAASTKPYGFMRFTPGPGVGGHCIPVDPYYLLWQLRAMRTSAPVIENSMAAIAARPGRIVERAIAQLDGISITGSKVLVVGVTYKPDVADVRQSPALEIMEGLRARGVHVEYHDPLVSSVVLRDGTSLKSSDQEGAEFDVVILHTLHSVGDYTWLDIHSNVLDATYRRQSVDAPVS